MNRELTDEQRQLADGVDRFGREHQGFGDWRARTMAGHGFDRRAWARMAELGWLMLRVPEADGGLGGSAVDTMVVMQGIGRHLALEPYVGTAVLTPMLLPHMPGALRATVAAEIMAGETVVALADGEPDGRFDLAHIATTARPHGGGWVLDGHKTHALDGGEADRFIVPARTGGAIGEQAGVSLFLVPAASRGLGVMAARAIDHRRNAQLVLTGVEVPAESLIGGVGAGFALLRSAVDAAILARLAEAVGAMAAVLEQTLQHLRTRHQFGHALGTFQTLQHRAADMAVAYEEALAITELATAAEDLQSVEGRRLLSAAKARVGQTSLFVARQAVQLHGGMGTSDDVAISHYLKRLTMIDMCFGNAAEHRSYLAI